MRLIDLRPSTIKNSFPLMVMALGEDHSKVCYHYRTARSYDNSMDAKGLEIVMAGEDIVGGKEPDGLTVDALLAICEDQARHQSASNKRMHLVAMQLQAARRALATDESGGVTHSVATRGDSNLSTTALATAVATD